MNALRAAVAVLTVHAALLFFPPLPPVHKGSLWSYVLGYTAVVLFIRSLPDWSPAAVSAWARVRPSARLGSGVVAASVVAASGFLLRSVSPDTFARFGREEGLWEPLTLMAYGSAAGLLLLGSRRGAFGPEQGGAGSSSSRRLARLVGLGFVLLVLEEVDYLGVFGGLIGRVGGHYVGSPHDLVVLWRDGLVPAWVNLVLGAAAATTAVMLWRRGYLEPKPLLGLLMGWPGVWLILGFGLLVVALAGEAALLWIPFTDPSPEELVEVSGAILLLGFAFETRIALTAVASQGPDGREARTGEAAQEVGGPLGYRPRRAWLRTDARPRPWRGPRRRRRWREGDSTES